MDQIPYHRHTGTDSPQISYNDLIDVPPEAAVIPGLSSLDLGGDVDLAAHFRFENTVNARGGHDLVNSGATFTTAKYNNGANLGASNTSVHLKNTTTNLGATVDGPITF